MDVTRRSLLTNAARAAAAAALISAGFTPVSTRAHAAPTTEATSPHPQAVAPSYNHLIGIL